MKNKYLIRFLSASLALVMALGNIMPVYAAEVTVSEDTYKEIEMERNVDDSRYEDIDVTYDQASSYFVTIPKTISLGADKQASYSVKVEGDITADEQVCVVPVDAIKDTQIFDFYMHDMTAGSTKEDAVAEIVQNKFFWDCDDAASAYEETDNRVVAEGLSAGKWKGTFQMEISLKTNTSHIHSYEGIVTKEPTCTEEGEKKYTCSCGDSYTEKIPATGHHYADGECKDCGEKDPDHKHDYTVKVTKEPTCMEDGEKEYICGCGDSYTEVIPATGHHYEDGECKDCGEKDPDHKHDYKEIVIKEPTCTETGEKKYTCSCGDSYTEEIPVTDHDYVDGVCNECGKVKGEYTFHFNSWNVINSPAANAEYEFADYKLDDGEKIHLPEVTDACDAVEGWQYAKKERQIGLRNDNLPVGTYATTIDVKSWGTTTDKDTGVTTNAYWNQTAQSDEIVITEPSVIALIVTRDVGLARNDCGYSASVTLRDLDNDKQYSLLSLANTAVKTYDYGNVIITANRTEGKSKFNYSYSNSRAYYHYSIYLEPGTYKLYAAGSIGSSTNGKTPHSAMILDLGSSGYGSRCDLYSLHDLTEGMTFDASEIYTSEADGKNIYCVPKISIKKHYDNEYVSSAAKCTTDGTKTLTCSVCGLIRYETIPATGHNYEAVTKDASCTAAGSITYTCANCSDKYTETIEALGHDYVDSICTRCGNVNYVTAQVMYWMSDRKYNTTSYKYSDAFTLDKDMVDKEYLSIVCSLYNSSSMWTSSHYSGSVYLQKKNEETGAWANVKTYAIANTTKGPSYKIEGLESGTYRIYGYFKNSSTSNYYQMSVRATTYILG